MSHHRKLANKPPKVNTREAKDEPPKSNAEEKQNQNKFFWKKIVGRILLSGLMIFAVYWTSNKDKANVFASQKEVIKHRAQDISCSKSYQKEVTKFRGCVPKRCGRLVTDVIVSEGEAAHLLLIARKGMAFGSSSGGVSILDLHSGALSHGTAFINIYKKIADIGTDNVFTEQDFHLYKNVRQKIQHMIAFNFGIEPSKLYLTHPTFFSEMTPKAAKTIHDEYWHVHVDKENYQAFHYTSLLYLTDYGRDFTGGRFTFVEKSTNSTIEPKLGRVSAFTSGAENPHFVEKVSSGIRYALTVSFTCDKKFAIEDPSLKKVL